MVSIVIRKFRNGEIVKILNSFLGELTVSYELDQVPTTSITLPATEFEYFDRRNEVDIRINDFQFCGLVDRVTLDKDAETFNVELSHIVSEHSLESVPMNYGVKQNTIPNIYPSLATTPLGRDLWNYTYQGTAITTPIEYLYSRQNKLEGINATIEATEDVHWRVPICGCRDLEFGSFGENSGLAVGYWDKPTSNIDLIGGIEVFRDFRSTVNRAVVTSGNVGNGMGTMVLRDYLNGNLAQDPLFKISQNNTGVNTEEVYVDINAPEYAPNNEYEYYIDDLESIARENGQIYSSTFSYSDLYPIHDPTMPISNSDRLNAQKALYSRGKRHLIYSRRRDLLSMDTGAIPCTVNVGDRVLVSISNQLLENMPCGNAVRTVLAVKDNLVMTRIDKTFDANLMETNTITLDTDIRRLGFGGD